jgi:thioredoxin reductase
MSTEEYEIAIVGGGPAGLSAAIWLARYQRSVVLVDSGDPRNWQTRGVNGYLGLASVCPADLRALGREECRKYGVSLVDAIVTHARRTHDESFALDLHGRASVGGRRLLLAIGLRDVWPEIPGLAHVYGTDAHVCPDCDGYECRDKKVVVLGSGRKAVGVALNLTTWTSDIIICTNGDPGGIDKQEYCEKLDALNIPVLTERVESIGRSGASVHCLRLANGMELDAEKIFLAVPQHAADDLGDELGCARDDDGHIVIDAHYRSSVPNVYAAGDIVPGAQLAITAAADGAMAALAIHKSLVPDERKLRTVVPHSRTK